MAPKRSSIPRKSSPSTRIGKRVRRTPTPRTLTTRKSNPKIRTPRPKRVLDHDQLPALKPIKTKKNATGGQRNKKKPALDLSGIFPPIPTPFFDDEGIDFKAIEKNMAKWNKYNLRGIVVQGSNGEYVSLSHKERIRVVVEVKKLMKANRLLIAGSGCEGTFETIQLSKSMLKAGADAVLVVTPSYYKNSLIEDALYIHFWKIAQAIKPAPMIVYNMPANTGIDMSANLIIQLAKVPNIIGVKDSGGNIQKMAIIKNAAPSHFQILAGSAGFLLPALSIGAVGGICAFANACPQYCIDVFEKFKKGDYRSAQRIQLKIAEPNFAVTGSFGVPSMKKAMEWFGYAGGRCRYPLTPLSVQEKQKLAKIFIAAKLLDPKEATL